MHLTTPCVRELVYQVCSPGYSQTSRRGISIGTDEGKVLKTYGKPQTTLVTRNGVIYLFRSTQISFFIEGGAVKNWMVCACY